MDKVHNVHCDALEPALFSFAADRVGECRCHLEIDLHATAATAQRATINRLVGFLRPPCGGGFRLQLPFFFQLRKGRTHVERVFGVSHGAPASEAARVPLSIIRPFRSGRASMISPPVSPRVGALTYATLWWISWVRRRPCMRSALAAVLATPCHALRSST